MDIYSIVYNNAAFLELQYLSFKRHTEYFQSFVVVDNAPDEHTRRSIHDFAARYGCPVLPTRSPRFDNGGLSHQQAIQTVLDNMSGYTLMCDPDVFLLKQVDFGFDDDCVFAGLMQGTEKVKYLWPGFMLMCAHKLQEPLDLRGALINEDNLDDFIIPDTARGWTWEQYPEQIKTRIPADSGGLLCRYIRRYNPKIREFSLDFCREVCDTTCIIPEHLQHRYSDLFNFWVIGGGVLHSGRLSNWDHRPSDEIHRKTELVRDLVGYYL